jgi:hypothetical protein
VLKAGFQKLCLLVVCIQYQVHLQPASESN